MKKIEIAFAAALIAMTLPLTSCFKDEPLNAEADIEKAYIHLDDPSTMFFNVTDTLVNVLSTENTIVFNVRQSADLSDVALNFALTPGATISPANGSRHDFTAGDVTYTVTSEDGQWKREYTVHFKRVTRTVTEEIKFDFEDFELYKVNQSSYYIWLTEQSDGTKTEDWATGNPGFRISRSTAAPEEYPTVPLMQGYDGAGLCLTTRDTGSFGKMAGKPIAAGNIFLGKFDLSVAANIKTVLKATRFGLPFDHKPVRMTGYYQYKPGPLYVKGAGVGKDPIPHPEITDAGDIYAVLYRNHDKDGNAVVLFGDDVLSSPQIVAIARIPKTETTSEWTAFDLPFNYTEEIDKQLLMNRGYSLTVVFSSSIDGADFNGAIGSELLIDKVRLYIEQEEE